MRVSYRSYWTSNCFRTGTTHKYQNRHQITWKHSKKKSSNNGSGRRCSRTRTVKTRFFFFILKFWEKLQQQPSILPLPEWRLRGVQGMCQKRRTYPLLVLNWRSRDLTPLRGKDRGPSTDPVFLKQKKVRLIKFISTHVSLSLYISRLVY